MKEGGMEQGLWSASGASSRKRLTWKRERASAISLETPGTWRARTKKLCFMEIKTKKRTKSIILGALEWPEFMMATTLSLSHQNWRRFPEKWGYQSAQASTIGKSSCHSILIPLRLSMSMWGGQRPWNHLPLKYLPNPMVLAASVYNLRSGVEVTKESRKKERPFHLARKAFHMVISRKNALFRRIWWKRLEAPLVRLIMRCRKVLLGQQLYKRTAGYR